MSLFLVGPIWRNGLRALAVLLPFSSAVAAPIYNVPITLYGQFYGSGTLTGSLSLNVSGYPNTGWTISLSAGPSINNTTLSAITFGSAHSESLNAEGAPNTIEINTSGALNEPPLFYLEFQHALNVPGPDPFVIETTNTFVTSPDSGECNGFACTSASNERLLASGAAEVPEPAPLALLAGGFLVLIAARWRAGAGPGTSPAMR